MAASIQDMLDIFKSFLHDDRTYLSAIVIIVAVASFGLGRLSQTAIVAPTQSGVVLATSTPGNRAPAQETTVSNQSVDQSVGSVTGQLIGSKNGTKYHLLTCPGAKQIAEANKIYFAGVSEAKASGYTAAANCPGLQ